MPRRNSRRVGLAHHRGEARDPEHRFRHDAVLEAVLELPSFWRIAEVKVTDHPKRWPRIWCCRGRADVRLQVPPGDLPCPACRKSAKVDDVRQDRVWEHLPMSDDRVFLHARTPRVSRPEHGVVSVATPWASPKSGLTCDAEFHMLDLAKEMPFVQVAMKLHIGRHRVERVVSLWGIWRRRIRMDQVTAVTVDEKAVHKGHRYVSVVSDQDTHDVPFATKGRGARVLEESARGLRVHGGVTTDMNAGCEKGAAERFPNAEIVFDKYHVVSHMQKAVDEVRRQEQRTSPGLKKSRWLLLRNPSDLTRLQQARLGEILPRYRKVGRAYNLRLELQETLDAEPEAAITALRRWFFRATHSRLDPVIDVAYMIKRHWQGVVRAIQTRLSNAIAEGRNSVIQLAKQRARGFRHVQTFINAIFLVSSPLDRSLAIQPVQ